MSRLRFWWRYLRGRIPWDTGITPPEIVALVDQLTPGRALDLGCGTGTNSLYLAKRGWQTVGVDFVPSAIWQAKRKARTEKTPVDFYIADVTRLDFLDAPFDLAVDVGCLHALSNEQRPAYARGLARLVRPGGVFLLYAFLPAQMGSRPVGISPDDLAATFQPAFQIEAQTLGQDSGNGRASAWYTLRRV